MLTLTDENFEETISKSEKPILVDFYAFWCSPCFVLSPILDKLAQDFKEKIDFAKANLDVIPLVAQKYGIEKIPTVLLFKEGKPVSGFVGVLPEPVIKEWLEKNL